MSGRLDSWAAYAAGLPIQRGYEPVPQESLADHVCQVAEGLGRKKQSLFRILGLPAEPGAGLTTLLRQAAFEAALVGFPTLVMKPGQTELDIEAIRAFALHLSEAWKTDGESEQVSLVLVFDAEHFDLPQLTNLPAILASP